MCRGTYIYACDHAYDIAPCTRQLSPTARCERWTYERRLTGRCDKCKLTDLQDRFLGKTIKERRNMMKKVDAQQRLNDARNDLHSHQASQEQINRERGAREAHYARNTPDVHSQGLIPHNGLLVDPTPFPRRVMLGLLQSQLTSQRAGKLPRYGYSCGHIGMQMRLDRVEEEDPAGQIPKPFENTPWWSGVEYFYF